MEQLSLICDLVVFQICRPADRKPREASVVRRGSITRRTWADQKIGVTIPIPARPNGISVCYSRPKYVGKQVIDNFCIHFTPDVLARCMAARSRSFTD